MLELRKINNNLPLRLEMLRIEDFPAAKINFKLAEKEGRAIPKTPQELIFDLWHNELLSKYYVKKELEKFCCDIYL